MLTKKLLAAVGLAFALLLGASTDASANPWRGPYFRPAPVYRAPVYRVPVFVPVPVGSVTPGQVYVPPVYRPVVWHHHRWVRW